MPTKPESKILVAYFYWNCGRRTLEVGNTKRLAQTIADRIDCDTYEILPANPYPTSYEQTVARNVAEEQSDAGPAIASPLPDVTGYDTVLLGSPVWKVQAPMIMSTFTEEVDLTRKTVLLFVTYAVSGMGSVEGGYRTALPNATVRTGRAVRGETVTQAGKQLDTWLRTGGLLS